jgi:hypothetical protein
MLSLNMNCVSDFLPKRPKNSLVAYDGTPLSFTKFKKVAGYSRQNLLRHFSALTKSVFFCVSFARNWPSLKYLFLNYLLYELYFVLEYFIICYMCNISSFILHLPKISIHNYSSWLAVKSNTTQHFQRNHSLYYRPSIIDKFTLIKYLFRIVKSKEGKHLVSFTLNNITIM